MFALSLEDCRALDRKDPLWPMRDAFALEPDLIYLDGNSLGALPRATAQRVAQTVTNHWGQGLIRSWNSAGWFDLTSLVGDKIARLIGASPGEVLAVDSTSVNLFKVLSAAMSIVAARRPLQNCILSEADNFPTDLYIAQALCKQHGWALELVDLATDRCLSEVLHPRVGVVLLTHVNYRTGAMHNMAAATAAAHAVGALTVWDLAHSAGAVPVDLGGSNADFAVGCGYKYLNGGPGAPAFVWVNPQHVDRCEQPLSGWWGHQAPFAFVPQYQPARGIRRYQCGTQPILSLVALDTGVDTVLAAQDLADRTLLQDGGVDTGFGALQAAGRTLSQDANNRAALRPTSGCVGLKATPMDALRQKSLALTDLFIQLVEHRCGDHGLQIATPKDHALRGSQISLYRSGAEGSFAIVQALIARGVIGDFRASNGSGRHDILRFGIAPLYLGFEHIWHAVDHLQQVLDGEEWRDPRFAVPMAVT
jgi:kynureninase